MINRWVGGYRLTNFLGESPAFELYRAVDPDRPEVRLSVKRIPRNGVEADAFMRAFAGLAGQLAGITSPRTLRMQEILFDDEAAYMVGEYLHGHPLGVIVDGQGIGSAPNAATLVDQVAEAVAEAHGLGMTHGRLTAAQVLFAQPQQQLKLDELGLAPLLRALGLPGGEHVPGYAAPELTPDTVVVSPPAEVYALGCLLVHLLLGRAPQPPDEAGQVAEQLVSEREDLPPRLVELVRRATAPEPGDRLPGVAALRWLLTDRERTGLAPPAEVEPRDRKLDPAPAADVPVWVEVPAGPVKLGNASRQNESPVHELELAGFEMSATPITNRQYLRFCEATGHAPPADPPGWGRYLEDLPDHPVVNLTWADAVAYCGWLGAQTGDQVGLPTEAEWEKAARGGLEAALYPWGDESPDGRAHYAGRTHAVAPHLEGVQTRRVGCYEPNGYGLLDLAGNVWEWCADWYTPYGDEQPRVGVLRVARGGAWATEADCLRCAYRMSFHHTAHDFSIGMRCVRRGSAGR
jgi:serine/threonine-protein kinase